MAPNQSAEETLARSSRLSKLFLSIAKGKRQVKTSNDASLFLEAICNEENHSSCIETLIANPPALEALGRAIRFDTSPDFINKHLQPLLAYLADPSLKLLCNGDFIRQILLVLLEPPTLWNAMVQHHKSRQLHDTSQQTYAWLLLELLCWPDNCPILNARQLASEITETRQFIDSPVFAIRSIGHRLQHILQNQTSDLQVEDCGPGGRHDNDFPDFRKIAIYPTEDELLSQKTPFYRRADAVKDVGQESRVALHLDNQFRLLREDMLGELRNDVSTSLKGAKRGRDRLRLSGLSLHGSIYARGKFRNQFALTVICRSGLERFSKLSPIERKKYLAAADNRNFLRHESVGCLIDKDRVIAFAKILRLEDPLLNEDRPAVTLCIEPGPPLQKALLSLKTSSTVDFVMVDTAMFSYEPILKCLQSKLELPLANHLLCYEDESNTYTPLVPDTLINEISDCSGDELRGILHLPKPVTLDMSQRESLLSGLKDPVGLIQGPPGTGKSFIGALLAKALFTSTKEKILVLSYTNHALDQFLEDLLDIGIPRAGMVRLGSKFSARTSCLSLRDQQTRYRRSQNTWNIINNQEEKMRILEADLCSQLTRYKQSGVSNQQIFDYLEFSDDEEDCQIYEAFQVPMQGDGMNVVGKDGKAIDQFYLYERWKNGKDAGMFKDAGTSCDTAIWKIEVASRKTKIKSWTESLLQERLSSISSKARNYNDCQQLSTWTIKQQTVDVLKDKRVIACTTTGAAMYTRELQSASPGIVLVEEAGEILESHVLTAMSSSTKQLILIGDHKQLRPKVDNYALTVAKGDGYNLNMSLFERLVLSGFRHTTLSEQHRMCPEISNFIRNLTYPSLLDAPQTHTRSPIRGIQGRVIFINHNCLEVNADFADRRDQSSSVSKRNMFEVDMVLQIARYLAQQGYGTEDQVILTPYLGQLSQLRKALSVNNDPVLNDPDSFDLVKAGLLPPSSANHSKKPIKLSTIDNYQGEESNIVIATLTRSNTAGQIGFMAEPERLNVLLSRARDALIIIGNAETFMKSHKGQSTWKPFLDALGHNGQLWDGFPVCCEQHPDVKAVLQVPDDFEKHCPDGGCSASCGALLLCGIHECPQKCHQLSDHSKMKCDVVMKTSCTEKHQTTYRCFEKKPSTCKKCETIARKKAEDLQRNHDLEVKREAMQESYARELRGIQDELDYERRLLRERQNREAQDRILQQHRNDLTSLRNAMSTTVISDIAGTSTIPDKTIEASSSEPQQESCIHLSQPSSPDAQQSLQDNDETQPCTDKQWQQPKSDSREEWEHQKRFQGAENSALDELMGMIGLEDVKDQFLDVKAKVDTAVRQGVNLTAERFGAVLLGNPGTGKTTVARLYARFLTSVGAFPGTSFEETTGARLASEGVQGCKALLDKILNSGGGAMFIDEAYQLTSGNNHGGASILDFLLAEVENLTGKVIFILAGYDRQMESLFAHNPGIPSRFPIEMRFKDYEDAELLEILKYCFEKRYNGRMQVEGGVRGLYARIVSRRIGRGRGTVGFGNARAVENTISCITKRQAKRLRLERKVWKATDDLILTKEDMIGPAPANVLVKNASWAKLQQLIGLESVKESVQALFDSITANYNRELHEQPLINFVLNKVFLGSPGTGKTTVAKLYGQILADIGMLSSGEVVIKTPADFVGNVLGASEVTTKGILASTLGKVLVIDEAYALYGGDGQDFFKTAVIDTIVAEVQSVPGDDRCVILIGYKDQMEKMFPNVNPGLTRRFPLDAAFTFDDFSDSELCSIFDFKVKQQGFKTTPQAQKTALGMLNLARNRPNFGNAGEVDILLNAAKLRQQKRISKDRSSVSTIFEAEDFDPDFERAERATTNIEKLFQETVGCQDVIAQLQGYQITVANMRARDLDPKEQIPFTFLFRGPPGTGKTTTARRMGKVYYDMGFLSTAEVIECSASDLVGKYIGHTGPKTQKLLEKALGKVLFIDEAYRLAEGHFAKEAMDEIVDCLTKEQFAQKLVVILAGYDADINRLMDTNPGLTSRFPETVVFRGMDPQSCLVLLCQLLEKKEVLNVDALSPPSPELEADILNGFVTLAGLDNWGSARDVQTIYKGIFAKIMKSSTPSNERPIISRQVIMEELTRMIFERRQRHQHRSSHITSQMSESLRQRAKIASFAPTDTLSSQNGSPNTVSIDLSKGMVKLPEHGKDRERSAKAGAPDDDIAGTRDQGVSDTIWQQLLVDKEVARRQDLEHKEILEQERSIHESMEEDATEADQEERQESREKNNIDRTEAKRERERVRIEKLTKLGEVEKKRHEMAERQREEEAVNARLTQMGVCCMGYRWIKQSSGYRCAGGSHFMANDQLVAAMN